MSWVLNSSEDTCWNSVVTFSLWFHFLSCWDYDSSCGSVCRLLPFTIMVPFWIVLFTCLIIFMHTEITNLSAFFSKERSEQYCSAVVFHLQLIFSCMGFVEHRWPVGITFWVKFQLSVSLRGWTFPPSVYIQVSVAQVIWSRKILMRNVHMEISDVCIFLLYRVSLFLNKGNAENRSEFSKLRYSYDKLRDM